MRRKLGIIFGVITLLAAIAGAVILQNRDNFIINYGIYNYRMARGSLLAVLIAAAAITFVLSVLERKQDKRKENTVSEEPEPVLNHEEEGRQLYESLSAYQRGKWKGLSDLSSIIRQMTQMDDYQAKLKKLLVENQADALSDTESLLEQIEDGMFSNIRRVLNFLNVAGPEDLEKVRQETGKCISQNRELLEKTKDFLFVLTDYLSQETGTSADSLDSYKQAILAVLKEQQ